MKQIDNPFVDMANARLGIEGSRIPVVLRECYAQCGEDLIVESLLRARLLKQRRPMHSVAYVEIGANHPVATNSTYLFYEKYGARGVLVDADPALIPNLEQVRAGDKILNVAISAKNDATATLHVAALSELSSVRPGHTDHFGSIEGNAGVVRTVTVPNLHIHEFLGRYASGDVDFLSIDCEGIDLEIIAAMDLNRFRPYVIQCEPSDHIEPGTSERITNLMEASGYRLVAKTDVNLIFIRSQQASAKDLSILDHAKLFQKRLVKKIWRTLPKRRR